MGIKLTKRKILFITIPILILVVICCIIIILIGLVFGLSALPNFQENPISTNSSATTSLLYLSFLTIKSSLFIDLGGENPTTLLLELIITERHKP